MPEACTAGVAALTLVLCSDEAIAKINGQWRGKHAPTDVLSVEVGPPPPGSPIRLLGDLYISLPTAEQQAAERRHELVCWKCVSFMGLGHTHCSVSADTRCWMKCASCWCMVCCTCWALTMSAAPRMPQTWPELRRKSWPT